MEIHKFYITDITKKTIPDLVKERQKIEETIHSKGDRFYLQSGREIIFNGVNIQAKSPQAKKISSRFKEPALINEEISFVNSPFTLEEAAEHFARLKFCGKNCVRFAVVWEAIEPVKRGDFDEDYLTYMHDFVSLASEYGLYVILDIHQDVWSRFSGGCGAPRWTFDAVGMSVEHFNEAGAAHLYSEESNLGNLVWITGEAKFAAATMFTLFFGGRHLAPKTKLEGVNIQDYLQESYFRVIKVLLQRLSGLKNFFAIEIMNEPSNGWIEHHTSANPSVVNLGFQPTIEKSIFLASGHAQMVPYWEKKPFGFKCVGSRVLNSTGKRVWKDRCVWEENEVWKSVDGKPVIIKKNHFTHVNGKRVQFERDFYLPFLEKAYKVVRAIDQNVFIFIENRVGKAAPKLPTKNKHHIVFSFHWYDALMMVFRRFVPILAIDMLKKRLVIGNKKRIHNSLSKQISKLKNRGKKHLGKYPTFLSEFGLLFSFANKRYYFSDENSTAVKALDRSYRAIEENVLSSCLWNYNPHNTIMKGDYWNGEDFSIFSYDLVHNANNVLEGIKAKEAFIRPSLQKITGKLISVSFTPFLKRFKCQWETNSISEPTEIFLPQIQYPKGFKVVVDKGELFYRRNEQKLLVYSKMRHSKVSLLIEPLS